MEIILKTDITGVGYKNDIVSVKPGYGRNYLIPQGFAVMATPSNKKVVAENVRQAAHKVEKIKNDALALAEQI
ncbi:MAG: 50S ribosomal protein L9, partial [Proteobacteria bacterium]